MTDTEIQLPSTNTIILPVTESWLRDSVLELSNQIVLESSQI